MLPKENRLTRKTDFNNIYRNGKFFYSFPIAVNFIANGLRKTRIGFSVGKNFSKRAVDRNRAKRAMREACRKYLEVMSDGFDIVVSQKNISTKSYDVDYLASKILFVLRSVKITKKR